jgi:hypothetical protein
MKALLDVGSRGRNAQAGARRKHDLTSPMDSRDCYITLIPSGLGAARTGSSAARAASCVSKTRTFRVQPVWSVIQSPETNPGAG